MSKTNKPDVLVIHNAAADGAQDEWRVSRLVDGTYVPFSGPHRDEATAGRIAYGLTLRIAGNVRRATTNNG